jgi:hypothetical protein
MAAGKRKRFWLKRKDRDLIDRFAEIAKLPSASAVGRQWLEDYVDKGIPLEEIPQMVELQVVAPEGLIAQAKDRAAREGIDLKDVIDWNIDQLRLL